MCQTLNTAPRVRYIRDAPTMFDLIGHYGYYQTCRSPAVVIVYCTKGGDYSWFMVHCSWFSLTLHLAWRGGSISLHLSRCCCCRCCRPAVASLPPATPTVSAIAFAAPAFAVAAITNTAVAVAAIATTAVAAQIVVDCCYIALPCRFRCLSSYGFLTTTGCRDTTRQ